MATVTYAPNDGKKPQASAGPLALRHVSNFHSDAIRELMEHEKNRGCFGRTTWGMHISLESIEKGQFRRR